MSLVPTNLDRLSPPCLNSWLPAAPLHIYSPGGRRLLEEEEDDDGTDDVSYQ